MVDALLKETSPVVLYESPHRIRKLLEEINARDPQRGIYLAHELTKVHELTTFGSAAMLIDRLGKDILEKGEFVVLIEPATL